MHLYKNDHENFFIQLDSTNFKQGEFKRVNVEEHEGAVDKHTPLISKEGKQIKVKIGDIMHPMTAEHHITMIFLKTKQGGQYKMLSYLDTPVVTFELSDGDIPIEVYGYCNLHGLWKESF